MRFSIKNNSIFTKGTPRILKNITGPLLCMLTGGGGNNNYWHWMFDVLPRIGLIEKYFNLNKFKVKIFTVEHNFDSIKRKKIRSLLKANGYKNKYKYISYMDDWYFLENLHL